MFDMHVCIGKIDKDVHALYVYNVINNNEHIIFLHLRWPIEYVYETSIQCLVENKCNTFVAQYNKYDVCTVYTTNVYLIVESYLDNIYLFINNIPLLLE